MATWLEPFAEFNGFQNTHFPKMDHILLGMVAGICTSVGFYRAHFKGRTIRTMVAGSMFLAPWAAFCSSW